ncbi:type-F conjugative transfer system secretin TraK [Thioalkalivibrio sp. ALMg11]|uniref:TraK domain-containing protein n=1 Tax=Thioalkalivibrio sp. ALMg11 TaxID=1158165 RepID=UPI001E4AF37A|nr:type-F conjugative transfer system secretin TraK [Thioalkalivibrio sp. ALMg11]
MRMMQKLVAVVAVQAALGLSATAIAADAPTHTVEPGQNLHLIAMSYGISWAELAELNDLQNPNEIEEGMELVLPERLAGRMPTQRSDGPVAPPAPERSSGAIPTVSGAPAALTQVHPVEPNDTVEVSVSRGEVNRLAIEGGRITDVTGASEHLLIEGDDERGQVFFRFNPQTMRSGSSERTEWRPISLFVSDDRGATYTVILRPDGQSTTSIILRPTFGQLPHTINHKRTTGPGTPYQQRLMGLIRTMHRNDKDSSHYQATPRGTETQRWDGLPMRLIRDWSGDGLMGQEYSVRNDSSQRLSLSEAEFATQGVLAVAIDEHELEPGEAARVFVVQQSAGGR